MKGVVKILCQNVFKVWLLHKVGNGNPHRNSFQRVTKGWEASELGCPGGGID